MQLVAAVCSSCEQTAACFFDEMCIRDSPMELRIHGYELTLRRADGEKVELSPIATRNSPTTPKEADRSPEIWLHPGLGEGGKYHVKADEHPLPPGTQLTFA